jgi:F-type H+-transporting ATPase subunit delta
MSIETVARRYASALADVVLEHGTAEAVRGEVAAFASMMKDNAELSAVFANPAIPHASKERVLAEIIARTKPSQTTANFLRVLLRNSRLSDLQAIKEKFEAELESRSGIVPAEVISAAELPENERLELERSLERLTGKKIKMKLAVDDGLIGGVVTRIGSTVYDGSIRTKLENLRQQLISG